MLIKVFIVAIMGGMMATAMAQGETDQGGLLHVEIKGPIDARSHRLVKLALEQAQRDSVGHVVLEINTFGGELASADKIRQAILAYTLPIHAFINPNAASAGALIAIACDSIYMASGATIGSASVVDGSGKLLADKYQSYMRALMRATAKSKGRDPRIAAAMVDGDLVIDSLAPAGKVLALTTEEALMRGYCDQELQTISAVRAALGEKGRLVSFRLSWIERYVTFLMHPTIAFLLISIMIYGLLTEVRTPGLGWPGLFAVVAAVFYLTPYYIYGLASYWELAVLVVGVVLIALEIFVIPGFGLAGIAGMALAIGALFLVMLDNDWFDFSLVFPSEIQAASLVMTLAVAVGGVVLVLGLWKLQELRWFQRITLANTMDPKAGYKAYEASAVLVGQTGVVHSPLRPSGKIKVDGRVYAACAANGQYIATGVAIEIQGLKSSEYVVAPVT